MSAQPALLSPDRLVQDEIACDCFQGAACSSAACSGAEPSATDLSGLRLITVPDTGPPFDPDPLAGAAVTVAARKLGYDSGSPVPGVIAVPGDVTSVDPAAGTGAAAAPWQPTAPGHSSKLAAGDVAPGGTKSSAGMTRCEDSDEWAEQFARLLAEALAGARPVRQILPWTSERARVHLDRLTPLFRCGRQPRVLRVIMSRPLRNVIEMTVIVGVGARTRALAVRLEQAAQRPRPSWGSPLPGGEPTATARRWVCTDSEAA